MGDRSQEAGDRTGEEKQDTVTGDWKQEKGQEKGDRKQETLIIIIKIFICLQKT